MMRQIKAALVATVGLANVAVAEPFSVPVGTLVSREQGFEAAMARIEARVLQFAGSGGVVEQFLEPYEPRPMHDPTYLIEFNRALAAYWTNSVDAAVEDFLASQAVLFDQMLSPSAFAVWQPLPANPDLLGNNLLQPADASDGPASLPQAALPGESVSGDLFAGEAGVSEVPGEAGFFADN